MKQTLQLRLSQHLALTPQLQQSIRLLQLSTQELNQEIDQLLQDNPLLELAEPHEGSFVPARDALTMPQAADTAACPNPDPANVAGNASDANDGAADAGNTYDDGYGAGNDSDWIGEMRSRQPRDANDDDGDYSELQSAEVSLREHLGAQLGLMQLDAHDRSLVSFLVEALDDDGYLEQEMEELADVLLGSLPGDAAKPEDGDREALLEELNIALRRLQSLDPPGIGARSPQECLALQLENQPPSPVRNLALTLVRSHLDLLAARDFAKLKRALRCNDDELRAAHALIRSLNPRPGAQYSPLDTRYILPDVVVRKQRGHWLVSLNQAAMPLLRINRLYADILQQQRGSGTAHAGLSGQLQEAKWLIKNVKQRFDTILRVSQAIVERQQQFLEHGEVAMRPLTLREIADTLGLHESTISRVTTQKFMATPRGIFELKYFFGSHVATDAGGAASSTAIRALIKQLVSEEDGRKPLSDAKITEILGRQGIVVARRTIAKYREGLNIPPVNLRKSL
ncbi:RNA polymerase, sigma 54 (sigma N) factor [Sterolibacterium denitrificans]|uniref:RNA polymerase sigma-54 factor n=1 Tax=Sterolibacterium denitrificans TaxID=157592 RepID=A0A7Z7MUN2_9PROT|nr:RNA polymerase factor sigma-54 [Sterolibacterium denitrificans]SMB23778.1 RNA polymerase, sigma 54 (sigma N) factor [Sterolibacterium denitrificans]